MNTERPTDYPLPTLFFAPLAHWYAGFDYAFGYQIKLVWDFWGISDDLY